ncbi:glycosyltransferase involved in cell wall biosynthesis [Lysobacter sp. OAE881]|uniref:glycosyltransferase family 2 protein n=1 Tax=Lysobacter sp. OAE881 TaxID=2663813 RepID=UPI001789E455
MTTSTTSTGSTAKPPRVSVVVPAYNNAEFIAATLESILAQDYDDFEVVVADHSSTDETAQVIARFAHDSRLRILAPTPRGGGAKANWTRVTANARGDLVKLVCGDDLIEPTALSEQVAAFDANPDAVLVACKRRLIDANGEVVLESRGLQGINGVLPGRRAVRATVLAGTNIFGEPACVLMKRDVLEQVGGWDSEFPYLIDQMSYSKVMLQGSMVALDRTLASFRISATQWSVRLVREQASQAAGYHRALQARNPGLLSATDVMIGNARAHATAYLRRLAYIWLRRRM